MKEAADVRDYLATKSEPPFALLLREVREAEPRSVDHVARVVDDMEAAKYKKEQLVFTDTFDENESEREILLSKPTCFLIVGKPCVGKTTLAKNLAEAWKSILVEPQHLIQQNIDENTETGQKFQEYLHRGESIYEELVMNLILDKLRSPEVAHHGEYNTKNLHSYGMFKKDLEIELPEE
ncbi:adenylate kinase 9-like [Heptranchias perlo]|uniref:adenylate kinase 9-like n=1 Tax=Heptranchias perlo TaxID=212740 RepID=UPI003559EF67